MSVLVALLLLVPSLGQAPTLAASASSEGFSGSPTTSMSAPVRGTATHYCLPGQEGTSYCTRGYGPSDLVAAIDRKDTPWDKGDRLVVEANGKHVTVLVVDVCGCPGKRIIDLSSGAFRRLAPLGDGVIKVTISASVTLPATDAVAIPPQPRLSHR